MSVPNYVFDGNEENFRQLVLDNSHKGLVLVNFWTPQVGPCLKLWAELEALSQQYQGRFLLVNVNTDTQRRLVREAGVTSVPTVKLYAKGKVVDSIHGAQSAASLRAILDKHLPAVQHPAIAQALRAYRQGEVETALTLLDSARATAPDDRSLPAMQLKLLFRERRYADIADCNAALSDSLQQDAEIHQLVVHAELLQLAEQAPTVEELDRHLGAHPQDFDSLLQRAALALVADDYEYALECLFYVFQHDRQYRAGFPHKALLALFSLLGKDHALTRRFQQRMQDALH